MSGLLRCPGGVVQVGPGGFDRDGRGRGDNGWAEGCGAPPPPSPAGEGDSRGPRDVLRVWGGVGGAKVPGAPGTTQLQVGQPNSHNGRQEATCCPPGAVH